MTAWELVKAVEKRGGTLALNGDKICCDVPDDAADLIEVVRAQRAAIIEVLRQRAAGLPWPGYNLGKQFVCERCSTRFDTSAGYARHQVNGCDQTPPLPEPVRTLPSCSKCGSFALYREKSGAVTCETCRRSS